MAKGRSRWTNRRLMNLRGRLSIRESELSYFQPRWKRWRKRGFRSSVMRQALTSGAEQLLDFYGTLGALH